MSEKENLLKTIFEEYNDIFEESKNYCIDNIYEILSENKLYEFSGLNYGYSDEIKELNINDLLTVLNNSKNLSKLLESLSEGNYEYNYGDRRYKSMSDDLLYSIDVESDLGIDTLSNFICENFSEEFKSLFKDELGLEDESDDLDFYDCYEVCDGFFCGNTELDKYYDLVINPERIVAEWLEDEEVDTHRIIAARIEKFGLEDLNIGLDIILSIISSSNLLDRIENVIKSSCRKILSSFIFNYIEEQIKYLQGIDDISLEKLFYEFKKCDSIFDLMNIPAIQGRFISAQWSMAYKENMDKGFADKIKEDILSIFTIDTIKESCLDIEDTKLRDIFLSALNKFPEEKLIEYIDEYIESSLSRDSKLIRNIYTEDPYNLYILGSEIEKKEASFQIKEFEYNNLELEEKVSHLYKEICSLYKLEIIPYESCNIDDNTVLCDIRNATEIVLSDRPNKIVEFFEGIKSLLLKAFRLSEEACIENKELLDSFFNKIVKIQCYIINITYKGEISEIDFDEIISYRECLIKTVETSFVEMLKTVYVVEHIKNQLRSVLANDPKDEFPLARRGKRHFTINVGLTNTGKTFNAIEKLKQCTGDGVYLAPLRLLALEIQEKLNSEGILCTLSTGEEEDIIFEARHESLTIEKANFTKEYDVCVIDECQMISDKQRGYAWTNAILGIWCKDIHICTAPEGLNIILNLIESCGDSYEIINHERKTPLIMESNVYNMPTKKNDGSVREGDALIVFSKRQALLIAAQLRNKGISTSIIYGALPYQVRKTQFEMFLNKENKVLVSTDAIGMGINVPIKRIVFMENAKFDGTKRRLLKSSEVKQIAGRAGRFGMYDKGYVNATCDKKTIARLLNDDAPEIQKAYLMPPKTIVNVDKGLRQTIDVWRSMEFPSLYKKGDTSRLVNMLSELKKYENKLSKKELFSAITVPFDEKETELTTLFKTYLNSYIDKDELNKPTCSINSTLDELEIYYKKLDLYYSFGKTFGMNIDLEWLENEKIQVSQKITKMIVGSLSNIKKKCTSCGEQLDFTWEHKMCNKCFMKSRRYDYSWDDEEYYY